MDVALKEMGVRRTTGDVEVTYDEFSRWYIKSDHAIRSQIEQVQRPDSRAPLDPSGSARDDLSDTRPRPCGGLAQW